MELEDSIFFSFLLRSRIRAADFASCSGGEVDKEESMLFANESLQYIIYTGGMRT